MARSRGTGFKFLEALPEDGERRLMLAVLIDAIRTLTRKHGPTPHIHTHRAWLRERAWMEANDEAQPFSFIRICYALGLDAGYVRRCVLTPSLRRHGPSRRYAAKVEESWLRLAARASAAAHAASRRCPQRQACRQ